MSNCASRPSWPNVSCELKKERNAVILAHNYMEPALYYSVPDFTGDSLELSRKAAETDADVIVFCGVRFMAETAKILSPDKTVLLPAAKAGCSLAASITAEDVRNLKQQFPGVPVVTYVNTYADVKAETDICCTSSNAADGGGQPGQRPGDLPAGRVPGPERGPGDRQADHLSLPRPRMRNSTNWTTSSSAGTGSARSTSSSPWTTCENARVQFPDVIVLAHPECPPEVVDAADFSGSTSAMVKFVQESDARRYLLLTECSMGDNIAAENPDKEMIRICSIRCPHMNVITMEDTVAALEKMQYEINVPEDIRVKAYQAVKRMIDIGPSGKRD